MDLKKPMLHNKKRWIALLVCIVAVVTLAVTVLAMSLPGQNQMETVPTAPMAPTVPLFTTLPAVQDPTIPPTGPVEPTMPQIPEASHTTMQPQLGFAPAPPTLELNYLKNKDFQKVNGYITCKSEAYWIGVDVSVWQEEIDWEKVAASGVKFAMIRMAYRSWGRKGELHVDPRAEENLKGALAAGLKVGVYIYSQAKNPQEAVEEAWYLLDILDGRHLEMPVVYDWEVPSDPSARTQNVGAKTIHASAMAFCAEIKAAGYQPMVYFNQWQGSRKYNLAELRAAGIELWLAMYTRGMNYKYKVQMWQYTESGRVPGIEGDVDINLYFPYF
jgi:GH25 family lysozyme M1 (1,4-beta-N-acetylmuramidase)